MTPDDTILAMYEAATRFHGVIRQQLFNEFEEVIGAALLAAVEAVRSGVDIRDPKLYMQGIIRITMIRLASRSRREQQIPDAPLRDPHVGVGYRFDPEEDQCFVSEAPNPLDQILEAERRETGLHLVASAAPRDREILLRSFYLEEDQETIEQAMGIDSDAYRNLKHRAKSRLQRAAQTLAA